MLAALPEVLRYVAGPLQAMTDGRLDSAILRQLLIALAMIVIMLLRPRGLWPAPEHGKSLTQKDLNPSQKVRTWQKKPTMWCPGCRYLQALRRPASPL